MSLSDIGDYQFKFLYSFNDIVTFSKTKFCISMRENTKKELKGLLVVLVGPTTFNFLNVVYNNNVFKLLADC